MSPTVVHRFAKQEDIWEGVFRVCGALDALAMPNKFNDPGFRDETTDCIQPIPWAESHVFGFTPEQARRWFTIRDRQRSRQHGVKRYELLVCGKRWIGDAQVIFDLESAIEVDYFSAER